MWWYGPPALAQGLHRSALVNAHADDPFLCPFSYTPQQQDLDSWEEREEREGGAPPPPHLLQRPQQQQPQQQPQGPQGEEQQQQPWAEPRGLPPRVPSGQAPQGMGMERVSSPANRGVHQGGPISAAPPSQPGHGHGHGGQWQPPAAGKLGFGSFDQETLEQLTRSVPSAEQPGDDGRARPWRPGEGEGGLGRGLCCLAECRGL